MTPELKALLAAIRKCEAPRGYGQIYGGAKGVSKATDVSKLTLDEVLALQKRMLAAGSASTACGGYQFIRKTLMATIIEMGLGGNDVWTPALQDSMALHLIEKRGLSKFQAGKITREAFANNLAMEWASLPVVTKIRGQKRMVFPGETYYAGDDLNRALHRPADILALLDAIGKATGGVSPAPAAVVQPETPKPAPRPPRGLLTALIELIASFFNRK